MATLVEGLPVAQQAEVTAKAALRMEAITETVVRALRLGGSWLVVFGSALTLWVALGWAAPADTLRVSPIVVKVRPGERCRFVAWRGDAPVAGARWSLRGPGRLVGGADGTWVDYHAPWRSERAEEAVVRATLPRDEGQSGDSLIAHATASLAMGRVAGSDSCELCMSEPVMMPGGLAMFESMTRGDRQGAADLSGRGARGWRGWRCESAGAGVLLGPGGRDVCHQVHPDARRCGGGLHPPLALPARNVGRPAHRRVGRDPGAVQPSLSVAAALAHYRVVTTQRYARLSGEAVRREAGRLTMGGQP